MNHDPFWIAIGLIAIVVVMGTIVLAAIESIAAGGFAAVLGIARLVGLIKGFFGDR